MTRQQPARRIAPAAAALAGGPLVAAVAAMVVLATVALVVVVTAITAVSKVSTDQATFVYQCQSRLGASPGNTASVQLITANAAPTTPGGPAEPSYDLRYLQPSTTTAPTTTPLAPPPPATTSAAPRRNPYAEFSVPPGADARTAACVAAMQTGEFVALPVRQPGNEAGRRIAEFALGQLGVMVTQDGGTAAGPTDHTISPANLVRYVYYQVSGGRVIMPEDLAGQIGVGERVDPSAISPGDLVFYAFTPDSGPTKVMIAVSATEGVDPTPGRAITVTALPTGNVVIKRPHLEAL
jgi:cell wall-associated NlpC family hydrolase